MEDHWTKFSKSRQRTIKIRAGRYSECAVRAAPVEAGLWPGKIQQHNIGALLRSFEDNFTAVWRDVEVANVEVGTDIGQPPLGARIQVDDPKILMLNLSSQEHETPSSRQQGQVSSPPS